MAPRIIVFPFGNNPYQALLYQAILDLHPDVRVRYLRSSIRVLVFFPWVLLWMRLRGYKLMHLHWPNLGLSYDSSLPFAKQLSLHLSLYNMWWLRCLRIRIVWTVHNVLPHEQLTANDKRVAFCLARSADAKIVHSRETIDEMTIQGLSVKNCTVIPIGNYIGVYPNTTSREDARIGLRIEKEFVVLFFGAVRPYKGVDELLDAWAEIDRTERLLIIAGEIAHEAMRRRILESRDLGVRLYDGYQSDSDVERLFKACDVVCLPFRRITTSASALLALSFGKPIVAPRIGALVDLPDDVGYFYKATQEGALKESLGRAMRNTDDVQAHGVMAKKYARTLSWKTIGENTYGVYQKVLND